MESITDKERRARGPAAAVWPWLVPAPLWAAASPEPFHRVFHQRVTQRKQLRSVTHLLVSSLARLCPPEEHGVLRRGTRPRARGRQTPPRVQTSVTCAQKGCRPRGRERPFEPGAPAPGCV